MKEKITTQEQQDIEDFKQDLICVGVAVLVLCAIIFFVVWYGMGTRRTYTYSKDGEMNTSKECYINDKGTAMCKIDNRFVYVDYYYTED